MNDNADIDEFKPCAFYLNEQNVTEVCLKDGLIIWSLHEGNPGVQLGYDANGVLVAVQISGDVLTRQQRIDQ